MRCSRFAVSLVLMLLVLNFPFSDHSAGDRIDDGNDSGTLIEKVELASFQGEVLIDPGDDHIVTLDPSGLRIDPEPEEQLDPAAEQALSGAPAWMVTDLEHKFRLLSSTDQETFGHLMIDAPEERFRDEIAFCIAHSTPETLRDDNFFPEMFTHNAELIYEHDQYLDYVRIVEKENFTTLAYRQADGSEVELPRDIYYWFVVHPKLGDELPTYVDPEYDYTSDPPFDRNHGTAPPVGKFWREWFFSHNKEGQPLLKDSLRGKNTTLDAIKAVNGWISSSMQFTSNQERPVQPVRIYEKGIGRCGEYQDMRSAAARAALIPVVATSNSAEDHVWNEFRDLEWYHWDGTIDNPGMYENGWGKTISSVWNARGDGYTWSVTSRYSDVSTLEISVVDSRWEPVDGAMVEIMTENFYQPDVKTTTIRGTTDHNGSLVLEVGDGRNYWGKASTSDLGNDPAGVLPPKEIVMGSVAGETYKVLFQLPKAAPSINNIEQDPPVADPDSLILDIEFEVEGNILRGSSPVASGRFDLANTSGNMDLFITDQVGLQAYRAGAPFNSYSMLDRASGANISMNITGPGEWGIVFSNGFSQWTSKIVNYTITISGLYGIRIDSPEEDAGVMMDDRCEISGIYFCPGSDPIYTLEVRIGDEGRWMDVEKNMITHEGEREVRYFEHDWNIDLDGPGDVTIWVRLITEETEFLVHRRVYVEDLEPPRITVSQKDPMTRKGADLRLSGSVSDNHHVSSMSCSLYDAVYDIELLEGSWEVSVPTAHLDIGEQLIHIHARDPSGNIGVVEVRFDVLDNDPPEIDIYYPDRGSLFRKGETIRISGKIFERTEVEKLFVSIGDPRNIDIRDHLLDDGTFTYVLSTNLGSIEDGRNIIKVTAVDDGGNIGYGEVEVILDATAPLIDLREIPEEIVIRAGSDLEIMFPITDEIGVSEVLFSFNSGEFNDVTRYLDGDIFEMKIGRELDIGWNTITVRASDEAGSMSEESIECYVDDQSPDIRFTSIPEYVLIGEPLLIGIEIIEDDMISSLEVRSDGNSRYFGELYSGPLPVELDTGTSRGGVRKIDLIFSDRAGHLEERTIEVNFIREDTDSDEDGIPDLWEYSHDMDPLRFDSDDDPDGDGFSNLEEYLGDDGEPGNDDSTDPRSSGSYPSREIENTNNWAFIMFAIIGIILVGLIAYFIVSKRK